MAEPCRKCGATKTEPVYERALVNKFVRLFGYELRECAGCRSMRLLDGERARRRRIARVEVNALEAEPRRPPALRSSGASGDVQPSSFARDDAVPAASLPNGSGSDAGPSESGEPGCCPRCGGTTFRRSRRRQFERLLGRPPMARCLTCDFRFPSPPDSKSPSLV